MIDTTVNFYLNNIVIYVFDLIYVFQFVIAYIDTEVMCKLFVFIEFQIHSNLINLDLIKIGKGLPLHDLQSSHPLFIIIDTTISLAHIIVIIEI